MSSNLNLAKPEGLGLYGVCLVEILKVRKMGFSWLLVPSGPDFLIRVPRHLEVGGHFSEAAEAIKKKKEHKGINSMGNACEKLTENLNTKKKHNNCRLESICQNVGFL